MSPYQHVSTMVHKLSMTPYHLRLCRQQAIPAIARACSEAAIRAAGVGMSSVLFALQSDSIVRWKRLVAQDGPLWNQRRLTQCFGCRQAELLNLPRAVTIAR